MPHEIPEYVTARNIKNMHVCPRCGTYNIENSGEWWEDGRGVFEKVKCLDCGAEYYNVYNYTETEFYIEED